MSFSNVTERVTATVHARLPDALRSLDSRSEWADANRTGSKLECMLEGPSFDVEGNLYFCDLPFGRILKLRADGEFEVVVKYDGWPYGLKIHRDGRLFVTDFKRGILMIDPSSGDIRPFLKPHCPISFKGVNDLVFDRDGRLYFTDYGQTDMNDPSGRVFRADPDGKLEILSGSMAGPNGIALDAKEQLLYVAATRSNEIWRMAIATDGTVGKASIFARLTGGVGPGGLAVDRAGNLFVTHPGFGAVWGYNRRGEVIFRIDSPVGYELTNLAFGGPDGSTLFITEGGGDILAAELPERGVPMYSHSA